MTGQVERNDEGTFAAKHYRLPGENYFESMVPFFRYENVINAVKSQAEGRPVFELKEVVEFSMAGDNKHKPVFPVEAIYRTIDGRPITFAERWAEQYRQFINGDTQNVGGTPLEELQGYGITPAQLSMCRAHGIHSIEALDQLEGAGRKRLGIVGNELKPMARKFLETREAARYANATDDIGALKARIAELEATKSPAEPSDDDLKERIAQITGARPRGNPSRETLLTMLAEAEKVQA